MDTSKQTQDAQQGQQPGQQQGQMPPQEQQIARATSEVQQGQMQQGQMQQGQMQQGQMQQGAEGGNVARRPDASVGVLRPPVDVIEDAAGITLIADLPGVSRDNLNLRLEAQSLTIEAAMTLDLPADMEPRHAEVRHQHYERTFALSSELDGEQATAELNHGVLRVRIPKSRDAMPRKIPVNAG